MPHNALRRSYMAAAQHVEIFYARLSASITRNPRAFILIPVSIVFLISYPAVYTLYTNPSLVSFLSKGDFKGVRVVGGASSASSASSSSNSAHVSGAAGAAGATGAGADANVRVKQLWVQPSKTQRRPSCKEADLIQPAFSPSSLAGSSRGALDKQFLLEALQFQNELLRSLSLPAAGNSNHSTAFLYSIFQCWDNSPDKLSSDRAHVKTVQKCLRQQRQHQRQQQHQNPAIDVNAPGLLAGIGRVNGMVHSAEALKISLLYVENSDSHAAANGYDSPGKRWNQNLDSLKQSFATLVVFSKSPQLRSHRQFQLSLLKLSRSDRLILVFANALVSIYFALSLLNVHGVRSKLGLLLAFAVEMLLSILAAITLTFYWFRDLELLQIPLQVLSFIVVVVGIENMFRLLAAVSKLKDSIFVPLKFASAISQSNVTSTTIVGLDLLILLSIVPFVSDSAQQFCVFAAIALSIDHVLHLTYFTAVLSVDIRRLELEDLLERSRKSASQEDSNLAHSSNGSGYYTSLDSGGNSTMAKHNFASSSSSSWLSAAFAGLPSQAYQHSRTTPFRHVIGQYMLRAKLPFSSTVTSSILMLAVLVFVNINWVANGISFNVFELIEWGAAGANNALFNATSSSSSSSSSNSNGTFDQISSLARNSTSLVDRSSSLVNRTLQSIQHNIDADSSYPFVYFLKPKSLGVLISQLLSSSSATSSNWLNYISSHGLPQQKQQHSDSSGANPLRLQVIVEEPAFAVPKTAFTETELSDKRNFTLTDFISPNPATTYQLDFYYLLEFFVSFVFILTISTIILKLCLKNSPPDFTTDYDTSGNGIDGDHNDNKQGYSALSSHRMRSDIYGKGDTADAFQSKDLIRGHALDVVKISSNKSCPFIVSIGMDHRVLVWSPAAKPVPPPMSLPVARQIWPITHAVLSIHGNLIAVFSRRGYIKCWSRLNMSWIWSVEIAELKGTVPLEAFFRKKTVLGSVLRKRQQQRQQQQKQQEKEEQEELERQKQKKASATTPMRPGFSRQNSASSIRSTASNIKRGHQRHASISSNNAFEAPPPDSFVLENLDAEFELSLVLKNGKMYTISCADGSISETQITKEKICTTKLLISSRVNDRLVCGTQSGKIVVATVVNNKWRVRTLLIQEERYNRGKGLMTPLAMQRTTMKMLGSGGGITAAAAAAAAATNVANVAALPTGASVAHHGHNKLQRQASIGSMTNVVVPPKVPPEEFESSTIVAVSFVGMIVRTHGLTAELIDVQTGTLVKRFHIAQFKKGTFHVFHDQPTHCRFCGCASISSFSIVYTELDTSMLIMHTFSNENRAKNSICLRVERDPRETRCLGFNSVVEHQHWLENVEAWELTDLNMVQGVKRKNVANDGDSSSGAPAFTSPTYDNYYECGDNTNSGLRSRKNKFSLSSSSPSSSTSSTGFSSDSFYRRHYSRLNSKDHRAPSLTEIWEGFTMSATGKVTYHEIPPTNSNTSSTPSPSSIANNGNHNANTNNIGTDGEGLLVKRVSQITRFGHKAVVVPFGNVMKVLYLGNDGLISSNLDEQGNPNEKITGLSFVNKRRMRQSELMHSANFAELPSLKLRQS